MPTIVFFHAHPDDESSQTAGAMSRAADQGDRVVVVYATNGDHGTVPEDLAPGETLIQRRRREAEASALVTGAARIVWLGYADSGMAGWEQNRHEDAFARADPQQAAARLADVLDEEDAEVLVGYDWHGGYGHPDHVQVHRVAHLAAELAARRPRLLEVTFNRDRMRELAQRGRDAGMEEVFDPDAPMGDGNPMGSPEAEIHWRVDISDLLERKRAALACHASQTSDVGMMLEMPSEAFAAMFAAEYYIEPGRRPGMHEGWPFEAVTG